MALKAAALLCTSGSETALRIYDRKEKGREGGEKERAEQRPGKRREEKDERRKEQRQGKGGEGKRK